MARSWNILTDYGSVAYHFERSEPCANATTRERGEWGCLQGLPSVAPDFRVFQPGSTYQARVSQLFRKNVPGANRTRGAPC